METKQFRGQTAPNIRGRQFSCLPGAFPSDALWGSQKQVCSGPARGDFLPETLNQKLLFLWQGA